MAKQKKTGMRYCHEYDISKKSMIFKFSQQFEIRRANFEKKSNFQKKFGARALPRAARAQSHIAMKTQKSCFFLT